MTVVYTLNARGRRWWEEANQEKNKHRINRINRQISKHVVCAKKPSELFCMRRWDAVWCSPFVILFVCSSVCLFCLFLSVCFCLYHHISPLPRLWPLPSRVSVSFCLLPPRLLFTYLFCLYLSPLSLFVFFCLTLSFLSFVSVINCPLHYCVFVSFIIICLLYHC